LTSFIYCVDENLKNSFISKGYNLIKQESIQNQKAWIFEYKPEMQFDLTDKSKFFTLNTIRF
jgi:hypothetical protein